MTQIIITIVFGFLWWLVFNHVGAGLTYLLILGSVLAVCVCCCKGGEPQVGLVELQLGRLCAARRYSLFRCAVRDSVFRCRLEVENMHLQASLQLTH